ncbi:MAG: FAD binding domain-containing protein [Chloroflexota bacterium]
MTRYSAPHGLDEVLQALAAGARPVAGGTDLVVGMRQGRGGLPDDLVAIHRVSSIVGICPGEEGGLHIGAGTSHRDICADGEVVATYPALADGSAIVGSYATRSTGTLGGNVANASPAADCVAPLICFGAVATVRSASGERHVPVEGLVTGPRRTVLRPDELILGFELPAPAPGTGSAYVRLEYRRQMEIAIVGAGALVTLDGSGRITAARIAITALAPTVRRVPEAEAALVGTTGDEAARRTAGAAAAAGSSPIDDVRAPADYRRAMAAVVTRRAIAGALARARGETVAIPASSSLFGVD